MPTGQTSKQAEADGPTDNGVATIGGPGLVKLGKWKGEEAC